MSLVDDLKEAAATLRDADQDETDELAERLERHAAEFTRRTGPAVEVLKRAGVYKDAETTRCGSCHRPLQQCDRFGTVNGEGCLGIAARAALAVLEGRE